jgi:hypothetical protein
MGRRELTRVAAAGPPPTVWLRGQNDPVPVQRAPAGLAPGDEVVVELLDASRLLAVVATFGGSGGGGDHADADHADAFSPLTHGHGSLTVADTRATNAAPSAYAQGVRWEFKEAAAIGVAASGYAALQTVKPWGDSSGGSAYQVAHHDGVSWRRWAAAGGGSWGAWAKTFEDTGWQTPTFLNGWADYHTSYPFRYRKLNGVVFLAGLVKNGTVNTNIAVLPVGYRPSWDLYFTSHGFTSGSVFAESHWAIQTNGNVRHLSGGNTQVSLAGISFPADA